MKFYIIKEDNTEEEVTRQWKKEYDNKDVDIINGISETMLTVHNEMINVLWPKKVNVRKMVRTNSVIGAAENFGLCFFLKIIT